MAETVTFRSINLLTILDIKASEWSNSEYLDRPALI